MSSCRATNANPSITLTSYNMGNGRVTCEQAIRNLAKQDTAGGVDDSYARTADAYDTIRRWRQSAREAGDTTLVEIIDEMGEVEAGRIYAAARAQS